MHTLFFWHAEEGKKMYYSSFQSESLAVWGKLLEKGEDSSNNEIHDALLLGKYIEY